MPPTEGGAFKILKFVENKILLCLGIIFFAAGTINELVLSRADKEVYLCELNAMYSVFEKLD